jgi:nucleolar pre-ribosomal-associated protein 1
MPAASSSDIGSYSLKFDVLLRHSSEQQLTNTAYRTILADAACVGATVVDIKRVVSLIEHRLSQSEGRDDVVYALTMLLASILERSPSTMSSTSIFALKESIFVRPGIIKTSLMSATLPDLVRDGMFEFEFLTHANRPSGYHQLVKFTLNPRCEDDRLLISDISNYWLEMIKCSVKSDDNQVCCSSNIIKGLIVIGFRFSLLLSG